MPIILVAIACAVIAPILSSGPVWGEMMYPADAKCRRNWIPTAFFYSNFEKPEDMVSINQDMHVVLIEEYVLLHILIL